MSSEGGEYDQIRQKGPNVRRACNAQNEDGQAYIREVQKNSYQAKTGNIDRSFGSKEKGCKGTALSQDVRKTLLWENAIR